LEKDFKDSNNVIMDFSNIFKKKQKTKKIKKIDNESKKIEEKENDPQLND